MFFKKPKIYKNFIEDWETQEQIIVCKNGVFKRCRASSISYVIKKTSFENLGLVENDITYDFVGEENISLEEKPHMMKKIPKGIIDTVLKYYQVFAKKNLEVRLNIWHDKINGEFFIDSPFQEVTGVTVKDISFDHPEIKWDDKLKDTFPQKWDLKQRKREKEVELILDTHSHHNMGCSFSGTDNHADYYTSVGFKMIGVYKTVLKYPIIDLRYFVSPYSKARDLDSKTLSEDVVFFDYKDIVDESDNSCKEYDFNVLAKTVGISEKDLF